ncbi:hypothetical protein [Tunicatimonas pelagia]|uniref:hypothetical protein n=1 Tax=Tunicatimonas pelagia TaxID=931531 RepID=UPI002666A596|nr:hypothetical protein [Tunicatimonas pelagia]WKN45482.1 hypothetical protein P0M28_10990 [Tunicatimonas pelagia]
MKKLYLIGLLCLGSQWVLGQCLGDPITSFVLEKAEIVNQEDQSGEISVRIQGGSPPYIYKLVADHRGKGTKEVSISPATNQREYTFRDVPGNTSFFYRVEVISSNESKGQLLQAICQKRAVLNIELK